MKRFWTAFALLLVVSTAFAIGPTGYLERLRTGLVDKWVVDSTGTLTTGTVPFARLGGLSASSATLGGSALTIGTCSTNATTVTGATTAMAVVVSPVTYPGAQFYWRGYVSAADTVTTTVCSVASATPTTSVYRIRVIP
jgi:hypothetical protein